MCFFFWIISFFGHLPAKFLNILVSNFGFQSYFNPLTRLQTSAFENLLWVIEKMRSLSQGNIKPDQKKGQFLNMKEEFELNTPPSSNFIKFQETAAYYSRKFLRGNI